MAGRKCSSDSQESNGDHPLPRFESKERWSTDQDSPASSMVSHMLKRVDTYVTSDLSAAPDQKDVQLYAKYALGEQELNESDFRPITSFEDEVEALVGAPDFAEDTREVRDYRHNVSSVCKKEGWGKPSESRSYLEFLRNKPPDHKDDEKIYVEFFFPGEARTMVIRFELVDTVRKVKEQVHYKSKTKRFEVAEKWEDLLIKVRGRGEYLIHDDLRLFQFTHIQECRKRKRRARMCVEDKMKQDVKILDECEEHATDSYFPLWEAESCPPERSRGSLRPYANMWELPPRPFRVRLLGLENLAPDFTQPSWKDMGVSVGRMLEETGMLHVECLLFHGNQLLGRQMSRRVPFCSCPRWNDWITFPLLARNLPRATRLGWTVRVTFLGKTKEEERTLAWVMSMIVDHNDRLEMGKRCLRMWREGCVDPIVCTVENPERRKGRNVPQVVFEQDSFGFEVIHPAHRLYDPDFFKLPELPPKKEQEKLEAILTTTPMYVLSPAEKSLFFKYRYWCSKFPKALPKFLQSVNWVDPAQVEEVHRMLCLWEDLSPPEALELLDIKYPDMQVREYAVRMLDRMEDFELEDFVLQLTQVLKYEHYHDSPLSRFLLRRALKCKNLIGHTLYWFLKSEMHVPDVSERFGLLLGQYIRFCGQQRKDLLDQCNVLEKLRKVAKSIKEVPKEARKGVLKLNLQRLTLPSAFRLPLDPRMICSGLLVEKCRFMDSKKLPLWLVFENADRHGEPIYVMFKTGDDLRQDQLTLQMIRIMDRLWQNDPEDNLDLKMSPYGVVATGDEEGFIEIVLNSETSAKITKEYGGALASFSQNALMAWFSKFYDKTFDPRPEEREKKLREVKTNFLFSCAGYCVATYVLGIGDRHNDNIMVSRDGYLFHIDFGHFLGNFKTKFGFRRERAPFVFTPAFAYVMGGKDDKMFKEFITLCQKAFNILRKHGHMFMALFALMIATGIPELGSLDDIAYLEEAFSLDLTTEKAASKFKKLIYDSLSTKTTQINNAMHILAH